MNEQHKIEPKDKLKVPHESSAVSEPSSTPSSFSTQRNYFSTASDGRVTLTFPSSGHSAWSVQRHTSSPQPARYEPLITSSEFSVGGANQPSHEKTLRLMTDEALAAVLDSSDTEPKGHSNPGGNDLEAWVESSRQTIIESNDQGQNGQEDN